MSQHVSPHILVVDDDPLIRNLVSDYLSQHDLRVSVAADGKEMGELLERGIADLIVLDLRLPDGDGLGIARDCGKTPTCPSSS